jgi:hypothetical protein
MITVDITAVMPAAEKGRKASMVGISWNTWFFKVRLYNCMPLRDELEDNRLADPGSYVVRVERVRLVSDQDGLTRC